MIYRLRALPLMLLVSCASHPPPASEGQAKSAADQSSGAGESRQSQTPRVLHLRDARFGIEFDAPDDSWLAIDPRTAGGGAQVVWIWRSNQGQIDVQALDLSIAAGTPPDQETFARKHAEAFEAKGASVKIEQATLAGSPCLHLVVDRPDGYQQDMFILNQRDTNYSILITQHIRNSSLVRSVTKGFRLVAK